MGLATEVSAGEREVIRLYELKLPKEQVREVTGAEVAKALGVPELDQEYLDIFLLEALQELGLRGYLTEGLGIAEADLAPYAERIDAVDVAAVVVLSRAFKEKPARLKNGHPLDLVGAFREAKGAQAYVPLPPADMTEEPPEPQQAPQRRKSDAAMSGMVATGALLVLFVVVAIFVWLA